MGSQPKEELPVEPLSGTLSWQHSWHWAGDPVGSPKRPQIPLIWNKDDASGLLKLLNEITTDGVSTVADAKINHFLGCHCPFLLYVCNSLLVVFLGCQLELVVRCDN